MQFVIEAIILAIALLILFSWIATANQESFLHRLCEEIPGEFYRKPRADGRSYCFRGKFQEHQLLIEYRYPRFHTNPVAAPTELDLQIPLVQKFWLRLLPKTDAGTVEESGTGEELLDEPFFIAHSNQPEAASHFLAQPQIRQQFALLGNPQRLEIYRGILSVRYRNAPAVFDRSSFEITLKALLQMVYWYEMQAAFKINAISASGLCPYCRSALDAPQEQIYECSQCRTRIHESCWKENRHCTTWGCSSSLAV